MSDLSVWYAGFVAQLLGELDSVAEGSGTLLDHTVVVWVTELGTPVHGHSGGFTILAGGRKQLLQTRPVRPIPEHPCQSARRLSGDRPVLEPAVRQRAAGDGAA